MYVSYDKKFTLDDVKIVFSLATHQQEVQIVVVKDCMKINKILISNVHTRTFDEKIL